MVRLCIFTATCLAVLARAQCPWANSLGARDTAPPRGHLEEFEIHDEDVFLTSDVGGPMEDQESLKIGDTGPTLMEDWIFRQKITHFDHERVPERAVHARGAGAHGVFTSYGNHSDVTSASFLGSKGKETPVFVRFSTVAGSRGSADLARDVHGFATRFYTDEGNFDIVGNNIPVFFIQDAIQFPDLIHAVKPRSDNEIPQAATAHDSAWDFFSQQTTSLHTLFWAMSGHGIPRSYRHMDGFGVNTYRFVNDQGQSNFVKWHFKTKQGKASMVWDEAQHVAGKNADFHRDDLWAAIESGNFPEWELGVQIFSEETALSFDFNVLDATKIVPEELVPVTPLGVLKLNGNPANYFAETEQIMFQPGHIVRGIDFSEDPLLQGRLFSYLDTQLNRHGGPNFEQLPINRPKTAVHNNNRDGAGQMFIHKNTAPYSPNTLNKGSPKQANQGQGRGFFTAPNRQASGPLTRKRSKTFADHWSQPRLFYNSLTIEEQQQVINAMRFELSHVSREVQTSMIEQLSKVSDDISRRCAQALSLAWPMEVDKTYHHDNKTAGVSISSEKLPTIATLRVGVLASTGSDVSLGEAVQIKEALRADNVTVIVVAESLADRVDMTYSQADASSFDGLFVTEGGYNLTVATRTSPLYPRGRPAQIVLDTYNWYKPLTFLGSADENSLWPGFKATGKGVFRVATATDGVKEMRDGLAVFKFLDRLPLDSDPKQDDS